MSNFIGFLSFKSYFTWIFFFLIQTQETVFFPKEHLTNLHLFQLPGWICQLDLSVQQVAIRAFLLLPTPRGHIVDLLLKITLQYREYEASPSCLVSTLFWDLRLPERGVPYYLMDALGSKNLFNFRHPIWYHNFIVCYLGTVFFSAVY